MSHESSKDALYLRDRSRLYTKLNDEWKVKNDLSSLVMLARDTTSAIYVLGIINHKWTHHSTTEADKLSNYYVEQRWNTYVKDVIEECKNNRYIKDEAYKILTSAS